MRTLIVDDEPLARARLKRLLSDFDLINVVGEASNASEALKMVEALQPDLVMLDIEMPGMDGLTLADSLNQRRIPPAIILVTAHPEHALDAYRVGPSDYLLKPVDPCRLKAALERVGTPTRAHIEKQDEQIPWISYQIGNHLRRIPLDQVILFIAEDKYVKMIFEEGEAYVNHSLKELEKQFNAYITRIHRHLLVNTLKIQEFHTRGNTYFVRLAGLNEEFPVSRRNVSYLKSLIKKSRLSTEKNHLSDLD